jgi:chemotaxis methyl-accepting protein methylase
VKRAPPADLSDDLVGRLVTLAARWTGVCPESVHPENVRRAARSFLAAGTTAPELIKAAENGEGPVVEALRTAVSVGETYFFRYPDQFRLVEKLLRARPPGSRGFRAWSAGCASGEETYSIAALVWNLWPDARPPPEVLGTDHLAASVERARAGVYRAWSVRTSAPLAYPLFRDPSAEEMVIRAELQAITRFQVHNLLQPPPGVGFDLVFCRNVFIYYDPPTVVGLIERLSAALAPDGILVLGVADPVVRPAHLQPAGPPELRVYTRAVARARVRKPSVRRLPVVVRSVYASPRKAELPPVDPVAMHLELLHAIERGERRKAETLVAEIRRLAPGYLAVRLEQALMYKRFGEKAAARTQVRELLELLRRTPDDEVLLGPEPLPVSYYRTAAQALLNGFSEGGG